jgi:hypothetical protein
MLPALRMVMAHPQHAESPAPKQLSASTQGGAGANAFDCLRRRCIHKSHAMNSVENTQVLPGAGKFDCLKFLALRWIAPTKHATKPQQALILGRSVGWIPQ